MRSNIKALFFIMLVIVLAFNVIGCSQGSDSNSVTAPNTGAFQPTGTIQGHLFDAVTQQPIVGAIVDVGVTQAVTSATGEFVIYNVPADKDALNGTVTGVYRVTIDMRNVTSPVNMASAPTGTAFRYASFAHFDSVSVSYTSLDDTSGGNPGGGSGSNHDTPVTGLVAHADFTIGKLAANISGVVAFQKTLEPVGAGYTVKLISQGSNISGGGTTGGTGNNGNVIMTATTDANGAFQFTNVESLQTFAATAQSTDGLYSTGTGSYFITAPADGQTKVMNIQSGVAPTSTNAFTVAAMFVIPTDNVAPVVTTVTPERNTDLSLAANPSGAVVFTFSEAMKDTPYADLLSSNQVFTTTTTGLYDDIQVNFKGNKAGNIAHSLAWSADRKSLTVTIPNLAPSSIYEVDLGAAAGSVDKLVDVYGNALTSSPSISTRFTTNGAPTAAAIADLSIYNSASINAITGPGTQIPTLDWAPVSGAKAYNVYRQMVQVWPGTTAVTEVAPYTLIGSGAGSTFTEASALDFVENGEIQLKYNYVVRAVNSDATESGDSNVVTAADVIASRITATTAPSTFLADIADNNKTLVVSFNEPMRESTIVTPGNWTISGVTGTTMTVTAVRYDSQNLQATLTLSGNLTAANIVRSVIRTGADGVLNSTIGAATDAYRIPTGHGGLCVSAGNANGTLATAAAVAGDIRIATRAAVTDPPVGIYADATNVCRTTATAPDTQVVAVGASPAASQDGISAATYAVGTGIGAGAINSATTDFTLESVVAGDDVVVNQVMVTLSSSITDVAGNSIDTAFDQIDTNGNIH